MSDVKRVGRYEIGSLVAQGPSGAVYRAIADEKMFALKLVDVSRISAERLASLREAAHAMARMRHPAIVPFIEAIDHGRMVCLVSEFAEGESLAALLKSGEKPDLRRVWEIMRQVLEALEAAHAKGLHHGNLKPANVFVGRQGHCAVSDFGIAGLTGADSGLAEFMAPEQVTDGISDARTDIYQAGLLAYLLVARHMPFSGSREEVLHRVVQERPADPSSLVPKIAWQLDWVVQRALSKDPADRFNGAREFLDGLRLGLQESLGAPLPLAPAAVPLAPVAPERAPKPAPAKDALAQKAKMIAARPPAEPAKAPPPPPPPPKPRVLFVDDDERVLNALATLFRDEFDVNIAVGGAAALEFLKANPVQIVVSDQRMPGMAGVELLREIKKATPRTVRILLTGYSDLAAMVGSINEGEVFRFVKKPWDNDEIRGVMKEAAAVAAKLPPPTPAKLQAPRVAAALLVIDTDTALAKGLSRMLGADVTVHEAASAADAAKILQAHDVAAVLADLRAGSTGIVSLFKLLKAKRPNTLSILLSDQPDSEVVTELINQAHVHRFLAKPVSGKDLHAHVTEALARYSGLAQGVAPLANRLVPDAA
jgi:response regulator RpfG family c-di-GMP phosphodiesterase